MGKPDPLYRLVRLIARDINKKHKKMLGESSLKKTIRKDTNFI